MNGVYEEDLAWVHHAGFSAFARRAAPGVIAMLRKHGVANGFVIDAGCGSGFLSNALAGAGYEVLGIDISPAMIALAKECWSGGRLARRGSGEKAGGRGRPPLHFEIASLADPLPRADAVIAMGEIVNYLTDLAPVVAQLDTRLFIFDAAEVHVPHDSQWAGDAWSVQVARDFDPATRLLTRRMTIFRGERRSRATHVQRLYTSEELQLMLRAAGFRVSVRRSYGTVHLPPAHHVYVCTRT
ncbi:MAG TPA: methyltransferase domain-containing protein [Thermoanaerobaculia bacterium]|nr:methyltransferase domain-containing protein [Thermoanaerobaculia bacterium]